MANPAFTVNNRLKIDTVAEINTEFARHRPKEASPTPGTEDVPAFTNTNASQRTNSRMTLA